MDPIYLHNERLADVAFARILAAITSGELAVGDKILDGELAAKWGTSKTPIREAVQRLARLGIVQIRSSRSPQVRRVPGKEVSDTIEYATHYAAMTLRMVLPQMSATRRSDLADSFTAIAFRLDRDGDVSAAQLAALRLTFLLSPNSIARIFATNIDIVSAHALAGVTMGGHDQSSVAEMLTALATAVTDNDSAASERLVRQHFSPAA
ncbi:GntR family transcriptional regulator [Microbacterium sp. CBS5P-1]|nr:GntR family transcriptional regulator [Microbacterium excoecariae]NHI16888.1 GntR family transcriptional regulator [Microbacterium excoecariae]